MPNQLSIAIAGSTQRSAQCLQALLADFRISVSWVLTPAAKPIGRKQVLTTNPLALLADQHSLPIIEVEHKLDATVHQQVAAIAKPPDILLVVDFGYLVPQWLLQLPGIAPVNIHPSALPRWRGSSPGQFALLYGETHSAVSVIVMNELLDQGGIITQLPFVVDQTWTTSEYYQHSFSLMSEHLAQLLLDFAGGKHAVQAQPLASPTPIASRLSKADSFVPWNLVQKAVHTQSPVRYEQNTGLGEVLDQAWKASDNLQQTLERAVRALSPWPKLWTVVPTAQGEKRLQILSAKITADKFIPQHVVLEGKQAQDWNTLQIN